MEIFKLFGSILVDSSKAEESISKTEKNAESLGSKLGNGIKTAGKWALGVGAAAGVVGGAMLGVATKAADAASALDDTSQRTGMAAEEYQKYAYAAKLSGIETETLEKAMIKQQKAFADAKTGSKSMSEAYSKLGIDITNIGTSSEAFDQVIAKLADMEDITQRDALANDIFGKSYAELAPLLNEGSDGINKLKQEAVDLGGVMSNESVAAGAKFGDMLDSAKTMANGLFLEFGTALLPILTQFLTWAMENMPEIKETFETVFGAISTVVGGVWEIFSVSLLPILKGLWEWIEPNMPLIQGAVESAFKGISDVVKGVTDVFNGLSEGIRIAIEWLQSFDEEDKRPEDFDFEQNVNKGTGNKGSRNRISGSHASGLAYVPYDGYVAEVHKGEEIVNAQDKQSIVDLVRAFAQSNVNNQSNTQQKIELNVRLDSKVLARQLYDSLQNESKIRGKVLTQGV